MLKKIYYNGNIYTADKNKPYAEALYAEGEIIKYIGSNKDIDKYKSMADSIIDLKGKTVVPGFIDTHMHLLSYGESLSEVNLSKCNSIDEIIEVSKEFIKNNNIDSGKWLIGYGWNQENFECKNIPSRYDLDKISKDIPIVFKRACFHVLTCNTKALEIAGITAVTEVEGGQIDLHNGEPTGVLRENACGLLSDYIPKSNKNDRKESMKRAIKKLSSYGITGIHTDDLGRDDGTYQMLDIYKELDSEGMLDVRLYIQNRIESVEHVKDYFANEHEKHKDSLNNNFKLCSIKLLGDGSLGGQTAAMNEPYENSDNIGIALFSQDELDAIVEIAHLNDTAVVIHAIGDRIIDMSIKSFEKVMKNHPEHNVRHGIVHCQITSKSALEKIKENGILAYIQPIFIAADSKVVEKSIGKERAKYTYNWKTLNDSGVILAFGTDCPIEPPNPYENIYCAVTRKDLNGKPDGGFLHNQCLTVEQSIDAYTINSAYASYDENIKGSLEVGKLADFAVLSDNIFTIDSHKIKDITCLMTVKGGEIVYSAD